MTLNPKWYGVLACLCGFISSTFITNYAAYQPAGWFFSSVFALGVMAMACIAALGLILGIINVADGHKLFIKEEK